MLTRGRLMTILHTYHPRCCGAGREAAFGRLLHFSASQSRRIRLCKYIDIYKNIPTILHMGKLSPSEQRVLDLVRDRGVVRLRDITSDGLHPEHLRRLVAKGHLTRLARGVYAPSDFEPTENHGLAQAAIRVPDAVVCLLSALQFHELTTQLPRKVWVAIHPKAREPNLDWPPIEVHRFSGRSFTEGWTEHELEGVPVKIFDVAKTVADCFKFRTSVGVGVAIEALRETLRDKRATVDELMRYAEVCRVKRVMKPYLEALA